MHPSADPAVREQGERGEGWEKLNGDERQPVTTAAGL